ncbi:arylsulfatase [Paenarthrobacter aromaticivorans]|uniref:Arylsulfatase n=1 Tax=Paenarthrobacter aromaticivorans TaxID=2849150 RepID=A0ABS6ID06_9MICC|nr:arylsulfatase [Paenarthrobacter sp. MMS21-TAE1-1]MBU8868234.1 arylsulfatase [Paenarthrobacter sp. MMS21-TAE1-1]
MQHEFLGRIGTTVAESEAWWPEQHGANGSQPNILMVILDDTGWSDFGCFGSEINTPAIDGLAGQGLRYTNFHVTPLCSPTRASLLTGRNNHSVGMRFLADADTGFPNSRGCVRPDVPMLPELLRSNGYGTFLAGKWHLAPLNELTPAGPFHNWPLSRGFDRFYGFLDGCTDQYSPELIADNHSIQPPDRDGYHLSEDLAEQSIRFLKDHTTYRPHAPFYLQLALGATHAPFQAPREYIEKYIDVFTKGWDATRSDRLKRQVELGVVPDGTALTERLAEVRAWEDLDSTEQDVFTHLQAAFAGFLEHADAQIGRVVEALKAMDLYQNTIVLVMSDNGASREGGPTGDVDCNAPYSGVRRPAVEQVSLLPKLGGPLGGAHYPEGWAMAGNTPFRRYKQFVDLGGVRSPLVVSWPAGIKKAGEVRGQFLHAIDIMPTLLEAAGIETDTTFDGGSAVATFVDAKAKEPRETQFWEMLGHRAIRQGNWKAVTAHVHGEDYSRDDWRLYNTREDFAEAHDLAATELEQLQALQELWWQQAERVGAFPLDDRTLVELLTARGPAGLVNRKEIVFRPGQSHIPLASAITGSDRALEFTVHLEDFSPGMEGVLVSSGNQQGGYVLYVRNDVLIFEHHALGVRDVVKSDVVLPTGPQTVGLRLTPRDDKAALAELLHQDEVVAATTISATSSHLSFWGMDIGADPVSTVSAEYEAPFAFPEAAMDRVVLRFRDTPDLEDLAELIESTE